MQQTQTAIMNHKPSGDIVTTVNQPSVQSNINNNLKVNISASVNSVVNSVVKSTTQTVNGKTQTIPTAPDAKAKQVLKEAVDAVVNSFAKHTQGYGRGKFLMNIHRKNSILKTSHQNMIYSYFISFHFLLLTTLDVWC